MLEVGIILLSDLYLDAIKNKEKRLSSIHGDEFDDILKIASTEWVEYEPTKKQSYNVGVDSMAGIRNPFKESICLLLIALQ